MGEANNFALITGASRGLGAVLAAEFWTAGCNLLLVSRDEIALRSVVDSLPPRPSQTAYVLAADLSDTANVQTVCRFIAETQIRVEVLINNAAIQGPIGVLWENDWDTWNQTIQADLMSPVALCRTIAPAMIAGGSGSIINISGGGATGPRPNFTAYGTAKAALVRFSETLAQELAPHGVRVNCIAPGAMNTTMLAQVQAAGDRAGPNEIAAITKVMRDGGASMKRVAELCVFLASSTARGISGKLISAVWDPWETFPEHRQELESSDIYTLRRIVPKDRGKAWGNDQ